MSSQATLDYCYMDLAEDPWQYVFPARSAIQVFVRFLYDHPDFDFEALSPVIRQAYVATITEVRTRTGEYI